MEAAIVTAAAAVMGSLVGGGATIVTAWVTQKQLNRRELISAEIRKREALYGEFITETSKLAIDSLSHSLDNPEKIMPAYALLNRIRLTASDEVLSAADHMVHRITEQYLARNLTIEELRQHAVASTADPLKVFRAACRRELISLRLRA